MKLCIGLPFLALVHTGACTAWFPPNFQSWGLMTTLVVDRWLYITSGDIYYTNNTHETLNDTLVVDLSQSWSTANVSAKPYPIDPSTSLSGRVPMSWYNPDLDLVFLWGGWPYNTTPVFDLWSFKPDSTTGAVTWMNDQPLPQARDGPVAPTVGSAYATSETGLFSVGGYLIPDTLEGFQILNFSTQEWQQQAPTGNTNLMWSRMLFVPNFGEEGILVVVGGSTVQGSTASFGDYNDLRDISNISVYDIASSTWFAQTTRGGPRLAPLPRERLCAVGVSDQNSSSYEIFIFGGATSQSIAADAGEGSDYLDVWVLSLPAFTWFPANASSELMRVSHSCQIIGKSQMLVIGGSDPSLNADGSTANDPWHNGMNIFDLNEWKWTATYNANAAPYQRAQIISHHYAQDEGGPAWNSSTLEALFVNSTGATPTSSPAPGPVPPPPHHTSAGAIAGGVVGGMAGLALLLCGAFYLWRRRRRSGQAATTGGTQIHEKGEGLPFEKGEGLGHELEVPPSELDGSNELGSSTKHGGSAPQELMGSPAAPR